MAKTFKINDPQQVKRHYETKDKLDIRIQTHKRYTQPKIDFVTWTLEQSSWTGMEAVLDVGSGPGNYVTAVQERAREYLAGDLSAGMLASITADIPRIQLDAQRLPLPNASVDVVLAHHMLYHVPDLDECLRQIRRVLRSDGRLIAATNSQNSMAELKQLVMDIGRHFDHPNNCEESQTNLVASFNLENGRQLLDPHFNKVNRYTLNSALVFPSAEPVLAYMGSMKKYYLSFLPSDLIWDDIVPELSRRLNSQLEQQGSFRVNKKAGVFICYR